VDKRWITRGDRATPWALALDAQEDYLPTVPPVRWRYRLEVISLARNDDSRSEEGQAPLDAEQRWELISTKMFEDGRSEQRLYRRPE
jgi:hypothetical protein